VNGNKRQDAPITKQTDESVIKITEFVLYDCRLTCRMIADESDMSRETVRKILVRDLSMRK
jgi:DNA-binding Lrp family transcriptional regulator